MTIDSLANGHKIWTILQELDPQYFVGKLPEAPSKSNKWLSSWQNLKYIAKPLAQFITERNGHLPASMRHLDLKAVAMCDTDAKEDSIKAYLQADHNSARSADISLQLLKMVVFVTVNVNNNERYIKAMMELSPEQGKYLQDAIVEVREPSEAQEPAKRAQFEDVGAEDTVGHSATDRANTAAGPGSMDKDLYYEEQLGQMAAEASRLKDEKKNLQHDLRDLHDRIVRLQENNDVLQEKLTTTEDRLQQATASSNAQALVKELEARVKNQDDVIEGQETQLSTLTSKTESLEAEANRLRKDADKLQPLQDQFDEVKVERDSLARKANAMEKYKQKLQAAADSEKEINYLRNALDEARQLASHGEQHNVRLAELERAVGEYNRLLPNLENQLTDGESIRRRKDEQLDEMRRQLEAAQERSIKDQEIIAELTSAARDPFSDANETGALASELGAEGKLDKDMLVSPSLSPVSSQNTTKLANQERATDLEARNKRLNQTIEQSSFKTKMLQDMLDDQRKRNDELLKSNRSMGERLLALKEELDAAKAPSSARPDKKKTKYVAVARPNSRTDIPHSEEIEASLPSSSSPSSGIAVEHEATELARRLRYHEDLLARHREMVRKVMGIDDVGRAGPADEAKLSRVIDLLLSATNLGPDKQTLDEDEETSEEYLRRLAENVKRVRGILSDAKKRHASLFASFPVDVHPGQAGTHEPSTHSGNGAGSVDTPTTPVTPFPRASDSAHSMHSPPAEGPAVKVTTTSPPARPSAPEPTSPVARTPSPLTLSPDLPKSDSNAPVLEPVTKPKRSPSPTPAALAVALPPDFPDFSITHGMMGGEIAPMSGFLAVPPKASLPASEPRRPSSSSSIKTIKATAKPVTRPISKFFSRMFSGSPKSSTANAKTSTQAPPTSASTPVKPPSAAKIPTPSEPAPSPRAASTASRPQQVRNSVITPRSPPSNGRQWPGAIRR